MPRVLVSDTLSEQGLAILRQHQGFDIDYKPGLNEEALAAAIPGARVTVVPGDHSTTLRAPAFAAALAGFLGAA